MNESQVENCGRATESVIAEQGSPPEQASSRRRRARIPPLVAVERDGLLPLSFAQERLWFLEQLGLVGTAYNMPFALRLDGELNLPALERSFAQLLRRHESLRTRFIMVEGAPAQVIDPPGPFSLRVRDLADLPAEDKSLAWRELSREEAQRPFDLRESPLLRASILKLGPREHILLLTIHHIAADGWSLGILYRELGSLYGAFSQGLQSPLTDLSVQYADYAAWQRDWLSAGVLQEQLQYWKDRLSGAPMELSLPADRPRPAVASFNGEIVLFDLPAALVRALEQLARKEQATLFMVVLAAFQLLLSRLTGQLDVVVGSAAAGRTHPLVEDLIGFFVNTLALRTDLSGNPTFRGLLSRVREVTLGAYAHQHLPFEKLVKELHPDRNLMRQPVFQVALALQNVPQEALELPGLKWTKLHVEQGTALFDLTMQLFEEQGGLRGELEYTTDLFERATIERLARQLQLLLEAIVADPDSPIDEYSLSERDKALRPIRCSGPARDLSSDQDIVRILERHAQTNPNRPSVCLSNRVLTYRQLNDAANQLARRLVARGIRPEQRVGVHLGRSFEGIISFYAILKVAAVYVPLEPGQPQERLTWMCRDADIRHILTPAGKPALLPLPGAEYIEVEHEQLVQQENGSGNVSIPSMWSSAAYAIYTSGSTGKPKGVLLHRLGLANVAVAQRNTFALRSDDRVIQLASLGFDASVFEFVLALGAGAALYLGSREELLPGPELTEFVSRHAISVMVITPSALAALSAPRLPSIRTIVVAGEEFPVELARAWAKKCRVFNAYGPTEATIWATTHACTVEESVGRVPIGEPIQNTQIYILNSLSRPVTLGEVGELCIGGAGVALRYINSPDLTSDRFIEEPHIGPGRLYRTGDLARWRLDGELEFLGRIDEQTKIRGYRIEPGEVEAVLQEHPAVKQAAVLVREDNRGERRLVAYVVGDRASAAAANRYNTADWLRHEVVSEWEALYEGTYGKTDSGRGPSFIGWNSSFTGEPIPEDEMQEWLSGTVQRILSLLPRRVLEVGCGVGLVLQHVAPHCEAYLGTDISAAALGQLQAWIQGRPDLRHVRLRQAAATELESLEGESFDTIILNSVIQYFPDIEYLIVVLRQVARLVRPGGHIFIGDVRHLGLLSTFHSAVQLFKAGAETSVEQLRTRITRAIAQEKELVLDPLFFERLADAMPGLSGATILLKRGCSSNELGRYRYDAILSAGQSAAGSFSYPTVSWPIEVKSLAALDAMFASGRWNSFRVLSIPNSRLCRDIAANRLIESSDPSTDAGHLHLSLDRLGAEGLDPEDVLAMAVRYGYHGTARWADDGELGSFEVRVTRDADSARIKPDRPRMPERTTDWSQYANDPLESGFRHRLVPALRELLENRLPEYMIPSHWIVLNRFPLTPSGKLDRRALPMPPERPEELGEYVPPRTEIEWLVAESWARVLRVDKVGMRDNFFELGGHSLLIVKMLEELRQRGVSAQVRDVYSCPRLDQFIATLREADGGSADAALSGIPPGAGEITPEMIPLIDYLDAEQIALIVRSVPGGVENVQDIYPLAPMQEGMLFHYLLNADGPDVYVRTTVLKLSSRRALDQITGALRTLINRHDVLRTAFVWEELPKPVQVVLREAELKVEILEREAGVAPLEQLTRRMSSGRLRLDLRRPPLMRVEVVSDDDGSQWYALLHTHHLVCDNESGHLLLQEVKAFIEGREQELPAPVPFRSHVAGLLVRQREVDAREFFANRLGDVTEPTAPFGLLDVHGDGSEIEEARVVLDRALGAKLRACAKRAGVTAATLFHATWALVVSITAARGDVVYGSVLLGRLHGAVTPERGLGMFINTLPVRAKLEGMTVAKLIEETQEQLAQLFEFEHVPLAFAQRCSALTGATPLFTSILNFRHGGGTLGEAFKGSSEIVPIGEYGRTNYPILLSVEDRDDEFVLEMETDRRIDPRRMLSYVRTALESLVDALERRPSMPALSLRMLPEEERREVIEAFNPKRTYPQEKFIHEAFEAQVRRRPLMVAVSCEEQSLTYGELNGKANQLAWHLREQGIGPDQLVGLCVERSLEMVVGLLGILKAGGAYVPLDPDYPNDRLSYMLSDAKPRVILTQQRQRSRLIGVGAPVFALDSEWGDVGRYPQDNLSPEALGLRSDHLAYVIYTSGSTGRPKGAMNEHRAVVNRLTWMQEQYRLDDRDRVLQKTPFSFDVSVWEFFWTLMAGARLILARPEGHRDPAYLEELIEATGVTTMHFVPSMLQVFLQQHRAGRCPSLRRVVCSGEELSPSLQNKCLALLPQTRLYNLYGPTECAVDVTAWECVADPDCHRVPIGRPIANSQIYILDGRLEPVPIGVTGEIFIAGAGVGRGYWNRPELTAERFIADRFSPDPRARMYKTGDLGRWRPDGVIEYLGRNDHQVKVRGFRIELGEIETQLAVHPQVAEAVVLARGDIQGEKRLVAYVIPVQPSEPPSSELLREYLKRTLPNYMIPSAFVTLDCWPLTANGKLDRQALPAPDLFSHASRDYEPPRGEVEEVLAGIWQELLKVARVGRHDNFFELGGHSLLIVQMLERLRRLRLSAEVRQVFESPVLADFAATLARGLRGDIEVPPNLIPEGCEKITPQMLPLIQLKPEHIERIVDAIPGGAPNVQDIYPLTPMQEGMLFHHLLDANRADAYARPMMLAVPSRERLNLLITGLQAVIDRHEVLRTAIRWDELPQPIQVVQRRATLPIDEITLESSRDIEQQLDEWIDAGGQRLDLGRAPLIRLQIAPDPASGGWYALLLTHHLVCDNQSLDILLTEVASYCQGSGLGLPRPLPYRNHVCEVLARARMRDSAAFFGEELRDIDEPTAPFGLLNVHGDGTRIKLAEEGIDAELAKRVRQQARRLAVSPATVFHAAWALVVACTTGRDDVVFGTTLLGRMLGSAGAQRILGMFINTLPLRVRLGGESAMELIQSVQRRLVDILCYEYASLASAQRCSGVPHSVPLFSSLLNYRGSAVNQGEMSGKASGFNVIRSHGRTNYPITISVDDLGDGFCVAAETDERLNPERMLGYLGMALDSLMRALETAPETKALALPVLTDRERDQVVEAFNATDAHYPKHKVIHQIFEEQVRLTPDAVAAEYKGMGITYMVLNERANQLAWYLRERGVGPDRLVGVCIDRSLEMLVALLGILKAGGAYVPLDPSYPPERLAYILEDATPEVVVSRGPLLANLPHRRGTLIDIDREWLEISHCSAENVGAEKQGLTPQHLAYVIYTSGSTGQPKGVMIEHKSVVALWSGLQDLYERSGACQRVAINAPLAFDASVQQLVQLLSGRTLIVIPEEHRRDPWLLLKTLAEADVECVDCTPSQLRTWIAANLLDGVARAMRMVLVGGEAVEPDLWNRLTACTQMRFFNVYGPTECTVDATAAAIDAFVSEPHIGRPMANRRVYILDQRGQPVPIGVQGEIYIGGAGIARGYLNRSELTAERFVEDPFSTAPSARMYRTGDLGRWRSDGTIEYLGRNDSQVKIRGYRIELGEIETHLAQHPKITEAAVIARDVEAGQSRLVAYVVAVDPEVPPGAEELIQYLERVIPGYMIPNSYVLLDKLPMTTSGKLDRRSLPEPDRGAYASHRYEGPEGRVEESLAGVWQELLGIENVSRDDDFFALGGHSLNAIQMIARVHALLGVRMPLSALYQNSTVKRLAEFITSAQFRQTDELAAAAMEFDDLIIRGDPLEHRPER